MVCMCVAKFPVEHSELHANPHILQMKEVRCLGNLQLAEHQTVSKRQRQGLYVLAGLGATASQVTLPLPWCVDPTA